MATDPEVERREVEGRYPSVGCPGPSPTLLKILYCRQSAIL